jgi:dolichol-phosphate mannosyltransferase
MADHELNLSVVIPAYNEESNIVPTILEILAALREEEIPFDVIVVNDNSTDGTEAVITTLMANHGEIRLVNRTPPGGFGRAIRSGLEFVNGEVVAVYMADQSDDPADLIRCYQRIEEGYDCVFGSRFIKGAKVTNYPWFKLFVNRIVNRMIQIMFWTRHNDLTNAFKLYRTHVIRECGPYKSSHFNLTIEMSLSALVRRYSIASEPVNWCGRTSGVSNLRLSQMGRRYLVVLLRMFFERILIADDLVAERLSNRLKDNQKRASFEHRLTALEKKLTKAEKTPGKNDSDG